MKNVLMKYTVNNFTYYCYFNEINYDEW